MASESVSVTSTVRVSEAVNPLTRDIDVADTGSLVRLLGASDAMLFTGYAGLPNISSDEMVGKGVRLARAIAAALAHADGRIVFSGCGTSGRLAHLTARAANAWLARRAGGSAGGSATRRFDYLLAGTDAALLLPQEAVEDAPSAGRDDFLAYLRTNGIADGTPVVLIGISCGLSATYVASMLHAALARPATTVVAMGFNPVAAVRHVRVDGWDHSFYSTLHDMLGAHADHAIVFNPAAGPETIAGSSRMKGGSVTKILLEGVINLGVELAAPGGATRSDDDAAAALRASYLQYEATVRRVYHAAAGLEALVDAGSAAATTHVELPGGEPVLAPGARFMSPVDTGRILYVGSGTAGLLGLIDASECNPTYGTFFNAVRGYVVGGWETVACKEGGVALTVPRHMRADAALPSGATPDALHFGLDAFVADVLPTLSRADVVVFVHLEEAGSSADADAAVSGALSTAALEAVAAASRAGARVAHAVVTAAGSAAAGALLEAVRAVAPVGAHVALPALVLGADAAAPSWPGELALKLVLNAVTVGAHVRKGTIYTNRMINLMLTNAKLFHRAIGIVGDVTGALHEQAARSVLRAIYAKDAVAGADGSRLVPHFVSAAAAGPVWTPEQRAAATFPAILALPVSSHVSHASSNLGIVPVAILLAADELAASRRGAPPTLTVAAAVDALRRQPVIRKALVEAIAPA